MTNRNLFYIFVSFSILLFNSFAFCSKLFKGNSKDTNKTFDFPIGCHVFSTKDETYNDFQLYIGADQKLKENNYSVAKFSRSKYDPKNGYEFVPLCPEKIKTIQSKKDPVPNPLYGQKISHMCLMGEYPVVVKNDDRKIYLLANNGLDKEGKDAHLYSSLDINDSRKLPASQIMKIKAIENMVLEGSYVLAAVKGDKNKNFGAKDSGSGIATALLINAEKKFKEENEKTKKEEEVKLNYIDLRLINADSSEKQGYRIKSNSNDEKAKKEEKTKEERWPQPTNKAVPFEGSINAIKINNDAEIISDVIDMHWDKRLRRLYIACTVRSNSESASGARAVVVGHFNEDHQLVFCPIVKDDAIKNNNQIIATGSSNSDISIQKVLTMHTSTLLSYLVVVGGNGSENQVGNKVYALPLVNREKEMVKPANSKEKPKPDLLHGTLAKYDQEPKHYFEREFLKDKGRVFVEPAQICSDLLTSDHQEAVVGLEDLPLSPNEKISDIFIVNDSVFVCINNNYDNVTSPGLFYSQAIFDSKGRIASWTKWKRTLGVDKKIKTAALDLAKGQFCYISHDKNKDHNRVQMTNWGKNHSDGLLGGPGENGKLGLISIFDRCFHPRQGGVQGLFDFSKNLEGFNNFSLLIATGLKKIALIESGSVRNNFYKSTKGDFLTNSSSSTNGQVPLMSHNTKFALIMGGELNNINAITQAEVVYDKNTNENWIFVAGVNGLAALIDDNGITWNGKISSLNQISPNCKFKKIGNYSFINKIQYDGEFLYVLTNDKLDRIKICSKDFKNGKVDATTIAHDLQFNKAAFYDFGVSNKFALLATSNGLYRVGNSKDIRRSNLQNINWTKVDVPESLSVISKLYFISTTDKESDFAFKGQVYVLSSYRGYNQARLNRFYVDLKNNIDNKTIEPLPDLFMKNKLSNYYDFGIFKENFWTDGSLLFSSSSKDNELDLYLHVLMPRILTGVRSFTIQNIPIDLELDSNSTDIFQIGKITRCSASGALLLNGNFGLRTNE